MKICHVSSMHPYDDDRIFQRACAGLASLGNDVTYIVTHSRDEVLLDVKIVALKKRTGIRKRIFSSIEATWKAKKLNPDIIHFHDPDLIPWMVLLSFTGRKIIYDVHENYASRIYALRVGKFIKNPLARLYRKFEKFAVNRFAGLVVVTQTMKNLFGEIKTPAIIIDNLVYLQRLKDVNVSAEKNTVPVIYTSGTNSPARNCMQTVEALPMIVKEIGNVKMMFAGRYYPEGYKERLMQRANELGMNEYIEFGDMIPWEENFKRTAEAHIGCVFYEDNANNRVTLPNRLYEYMYCGVAVLGEDFTEVKRVLKENECGVTVNSSNPSSIADAAIKMLKNPDATRKMGENGREAVVNRCNFDTALLSLQGFYKQILNN